MSAAAPGAPLVAIVMGSQSDWPTMKCAAEVLGLPPEHRVAIALPFGYPAEAAESRPGRPRLPLSEYVHEDRWRATG